MTLIISAHGLDCVVLGADSRGTTKHAGTRVEVNLMEKMFPVGTHTAVLICGDSGLTTNLVDLLRERVGKVKHSTRQLATALSKIAQNEARETLDVPAHPSYFPDVGFIVAGLDISRGKPPVPRSFTIQSDSGYRIGLAQRFAMDGKHLIARYVFSREYRPDMSLDDLELLVTGTLLETMSIDGDVGGRVQLGVITKKEGWRHILRQEIDAVERTWAAKHPHVMQ